MMYFTLNTEKVLVVLCTVVFFMGSLVFADNHEKDLTDQNNIPGSNKICRNEACVNAANAFLKSLDLTSQPCDNFYKHVCGNFQKDVEFPKTKSQFDKYSMISDVIIGQVAEILKKEIGPEEPKTFKLIKTHYNSCLNTTSIERRGLEPLQTILNKLGGWPVVLGNSWKEENFTWTKADEMIRSLGYATRYIFRPYVMRDLEDPSKNLLYVRILDTKLKDILHADYLINAYLDYMVNVAVLLGADRANATKELNETLAFELNLTTPQNFVDYFSFDMDKDRLTIKELQRIYPYMSWLEYLNNLTYPNIVIDENYEIRLESAVYLVAVEEILANTTQRVQANYMLWRLIDDSVDYLNDAIRDKKLLFEKVCIGVSESESRQTYCLTDMIRRGGGLLPGISTMYVEKLFKNGTQSKVGQIVSNIHDRYEDVLRNSLWLHNSTKESALKKHERMRTIIGYHEKLLDQDSLEKYYDGLHFESDNYFQNSLVLTNFTYGKSIKELTESPEENFWIEVGAAADVHIYYHKIYNAMVLPAAVLQFPLFDETLPNYVNYGSIGLFVGHEITHAFTLEDMPLDENGTQSLWWTEEDQKNFYKKAKCYVEHYDNLTTNEDRSLINQLGLNENMADNEGFKVAFDAYKHWKVNHDDEPLLPSLNYSNEQLFWISAASTLCTRRREENRKLQLYTDVHSNEELRINGALSNMPDFAKTFNCPVGTLMNPERKCTLF